MGNDLPASPPLRPASSLGEASPPFEPAAVPPLSDPPLPAVASRLPTTVPSLHALTKANKNTTDVEDEGFRVIPSE